jgi:endogenous inhibitor of DNA gyrase (YacG/DUF329 family)
MAEPTPARACPICGKPADPARRPFCSTRCRQIDLNRWLGEVYRVPASPEPDDEAERPPDADP